MQDRSEVERRAITILAAGFDVDRPEGVRRAPFNEEGRVIQPSKRHG